METFDYSRRPVAENEIRLITLLPGQETDKIECELSTGTLEAIIKNTAYEALSYCWGTLDATVEIYINDGTSRMGTILVKPNLHAALLIFRREKEARRLWIDAICIDQMSDREKNMQVPLMRRIYEGASGVLVWLGEGTKDSDRATSLVRRLNHAATLAESTLPNINIMSSQDLTKYGLPPLMSHDYTSLLSLLETNWFRRAWVVQEVTVAKKATLFWGTYSTELKDLISGMDFAIKLNLTFTIHPLANSFLPIAVEATAYRSRTCTLLGVLLRHRRSRATNPVDKVYAFLGLTGNCTAPQAEIQVDYGQNVGVVYIDVARKIAASDKSLDILSLPALPPGLGIEGLPSWVPDWSTPTEENSKQLRYTLNGETNSLANGEESEYRISTSFCAAQNTLYTGARLSSHDQSVLATRGHVVDTVATVGGLFEGLYIPSNLIAIFRTVRSLWRMRRTLSTWEDIGELHTHDSDDRYPSGESMVDAFWQTLATGNFSEEGDKYELRQIYEVYEHNRVLKMLGLRFIIAFLAASLPYIVSRLFRKPRGDFLTHWRYVLFRRMIRTEKKGYIGLVSGDVRNGDEIWLLEGSKVPLIIRNQTEGYNQLIGDAYIHGIMYGEAFKIDDCKDLMLR
ncbi:HET-domain-containing protein [Stipitochalara longipes BDJ]|nr:HET-domain-containing protein [Stipitochalara longipes BDJ]